MTVRRSSSRTGEGSWRSEGRHKYCFWVALDEGNIGTENLLTPFRKEGLVPYT